MTSAPRIYWLGPVCKGLCPDTPQVAYLKVSSIQASVLVVYSHSVLFKYIVQAEPICLASLMRNVLSSSGHWARLLSSPYGLLLYTWPSLPHLWQIHSDHWKWGNKNFFFEPGSQALRNLHYTIGRWLEEYKCLNYCCQTKIHCCKEL